MSENISTAIANNGESVMKQPLIKSMRVVKKETLKLISDWVSRTSDHQMVNFLSYIFPLLFQKFKFISLIYFVYIKYTLRDFFIRYWRTLYHHYWTLFYWIIKRQMFIVLESPKCLVLWPP